MSKKGWKRVVRERKRKSYRKAGLREVRVGLRNYACGEIVRVRGRVRLSEKGGKNGTNERNRDAPRTPLSPALLTRPSPAYMNMLSASFLSSSSSIRSALAATCMAVMLVGAIPSRSGPGGKGRDCSAVGLFVVCCCLGSKELVRTCCCDWELECWCCWTGSLRRGLMGVEGDVGGLEGRRPWT